MGTIRGGSRGSRLLLLVSVLTAVAAATVVFSVVFGGGQAATTARPGVPRDPPCAHLTDSSPAALTTPLMAQVARRNANTDLYVSNDASESLRLTVRIGGAVVYDAKVPGAGDCMHPPIYRSSYRLTAGATRVQVTASDGRTTSRTFRAGPHRWLTVAVQDDFPLGLDVWRQRPHFG